MAERKDPAAVSLGRRGGQKRVPKGLAKMSPEQRGRIVRSGAKAKWDAYYKAHPEKLKARREREARKRKVTK